MTICRTVLALALLSCALASACTTRMDLSVERLPGAEAVVAGGPDCPLERVTAEDAQTRGCLALGSAELRERGFTRGCTVERVGADLESVACSLGADALEIRPVGTSGCYEAQARYFRCDDLARGRSGASPAQR